MGEEKKNNRAELSDAALDIVTGGEGRRGSGGARTKIFCTRCGAELKHYEGELCSECKKNPAG